MDCNPEIPTVGHTGICSICQQVIKHPEFRGTCWRRKDGKAIPMSWSASLIQVAGGQTLK